MKDYILKPIGYNYLIMKGFWQRPPQFPLFAIGLDISHGKTTRLTLHWRESFISINKGDIENIKRDLVPLDEIYFETKLDQKIKLNAIKNSYSMKNDDDKIKFTSYLRDSRVEECECYLKDIKIGTNSYWHGANKYYLKRYE